MNTAVATTQKASRPPVVAILGHIDHGKSTLIDYIRKSNVVEKEAGGITQHASTYEITHNSKDGRSHEITFLDTPGHEAFGSMRNRCATAADIAALIVSAEDGVKPQTLEVYRQIQECSLPFIVVITKIDKPTANIEKTKQSLAENGIFVEGYGGNVPVIELSAKTGVGVDGFLDMIALVSELDGQTGDADVLGEGVIIETRMDAKRGITAVGVIKNGTVRRGLFASTSGAIAPIRFMLDAEGKMVEELSFSSPIQIVGWDKMPTIGHEFKTFLKKDEALAYAQEQESRIKSQESKNSETKEGVVILPLVVKADTSGSLEVIVGELEKLSRERIMPKVLSSGVGSVGENDIKSALTKAGTIVIGFNTKVDAQASALAERTGITILNFNIIYELKDKISELLLEKEPRVETEEVVGSAKVLRLFSSTKTKQVLGGRVLAGIIKNGAVVKIKRREAEIGIGKVKELQQSRVATETVSEGLEFGAMIESKIEIAPGDVFDAVITVTK